jgi:hypothetical protein
MKRLICLAAASLGLLLLAPAASAITVWQGEAVVIAASASCAFPGDERRSIGVGTVLKSIYRPRAVDDNGPTTRLSFIHDSGAMFVMIIDGNLGPPAPNGDFTGFGATHSGLIIANSFAGYAGYAQTPATVTAGRDFVTVNARVEDFMFLSGCDATFRASYTKR